MQNINSVHISIVFRVIAGLLLIFIIPFQVILEKLLMEITIESIIDIQHHRTELGSDILKLFKYFGDGKVINLTSIGIYNCFNPLISPTIIIYSTLVHYIANLIALILQEPRPFWYSSRVHSVLCSKGYGNPSISILVAATFLTITSVECFHKFKYRINIYILLFCFISTNAFGVFYLGDNFPHQIITSLFFGFIFLTIYFSLYEHISKFCLTSCYNYYKNRIFLIYWALFLFVLIAIEGILEIIVYTQPSKYPKLISNAVAHCSVDYNPDGSQNLYSSLEIFYTVGFAYGCMLNSKKMSIYWVTTSWWKRILRSTISAAGAFAVFIGFEAIPTKDYYTKSVLHHIIPNFIVGFSITFIWPKIFAKCSLISLMKPEIDEEEGLKKFKDKTII